MLMERVRALTARDYLALPESNEERYELIDGELVRMTTAKIMHNIIENNISFTIRSLLRGKGSLVFGSGQAVAVDERNILIPDVCVVLGKPQVRGNQRLLINPTVVVEVLSPSTYTRDLGEKLDLYRSIPSLETILIVEQHEPYVELYARDRNEWRRGVYSGLDATVPLGALGCELALAEVYQGLDFGAAD